ncbi:acyclic terpene utilization AtuA family protein [Crossiella sp. CA198]|uniref:acyclic terpene utilization AtuA family protein n=1 Tax=Crossiella sp. CA198 TaxID=3455607 RepID=UPI003F8D7EF2
MPDGVLRIGNASGFYGDRFSALREQLYDGELHILTGDYLAELTMLILGRDRLKDPALGYARTFPRQLEECLGVALERGVKIVTNAGGLNPAGLAAALRTLAERLGLAVRVGHVEGDDLRERAAELGFGEPLTANAYLGAWGIADCLRAGADVVVTGRVTDASLVVGPAAAHFGWDRQDWDALAGATVAGHVLECGTQATGGNFAFFADLDDPRRPGFPIAEIAADGSSVITKHPGTGGAVTVDTVTAQLLYEIAEPAYPGPDVTTRFDTIQLEDAGPDRVRIHGVTGVAPPERLKVCLNRLGGFRNSTTFVLCGLDVQRKADLVRTQLEDALGADGLTWTLARTDRADADTEETASALLHATIKDTDPKRVKAFSRSAIELALASYPGFHVTAPPGDGTPFGVYSAAYVDRAEVRQLAVLPDGTRIEVEEPPVTTAGPVQPLAGNDPVPFGGHEPTRRGPLGRIAGARSGDKGGDANLGVWVRSEPAYRWLFHHLTMDRLKELLPECAELTVQRHALPNLRAVNFVIRGLLGDGVASSTRFDPQAKALGEWLRARVVEVPEVLW